MARPLVTLVVAYSKNRVIGRDNTLPWRLPADLAHFKRSTMGRPIIMGRTTWESLGRALPGRANLVLTGSPAYQAPGATVYGSLEAALAACQSEPEVCIIGGAQVYQHALALALADQVIATEVQAHVEGDVFFPPLDPRQWRETERATQPAQNGYDFDFVVYRRQPAA